MWYGQKDTDRVISEYFHSNYVGCCIEVGVSDGIKGSNTLHFEEKGWKTVCVDPVPEHVEAARKIRKTVVQCACGENSDEEVDFWVFDIGENNIMSSLSALEPDPKLLVSHGHLINDCYKIKVNVRSLDAIIAEYLPETKIDFISIDTEGTELDVLKGLELSGLWYNIDLLVVENNHEDPDIENYLGHFGWIKDQRYFVNDFYVKKQYELQD